MWAWAANTFTIYSFTTHPTSVYAYKYTEFVILHLIGFRFIFISICCDVFELERFSDCCWWCGFIPVGYSDYSSILGKIVGIPCNLPTNVPMATQFLRLFKEFLAFIWRISSGLWPLFFHGGAISSINSHQSHTYSYGTVNRLDRARVAYTHHSE